MPRISKSKTAARKALAACVWKHTHSDFKGQYDFGRGRERSILKYDKKHGTTLVPFRTLSTRDLMARAGSKCKVTR